MPSDRERGNIHFDASDRGLPGYYWDFPTLAGGQELVALDVLPDRLEGGGAHGQAILQGVQTQARLQVPQLVSGVEAAGRRAAGGAEDLARRAGGVETARPVAL